MSVMNRTENVRKQYADDTNLSVRMNLHARYSTNKRGFFPWLFEQYTFKKDDSILDLGCGNGGQWNGRVGSLPRGCRLILSDLSDGMLETVRGKFLSYDNVSFQKIDTHDHHFKWWFDNSPIRAEYMHA